MVIVRVGRNFETPHAVMCRDAIKVDAMDYGCREKGSGRGGIEKVFTRTKETFQELRVCLHEACLKEGVSLVASFGLPHSAAPWRCLVRTSRTGPFRHDTMQLFLYLSNLNANTNCDVQQT